MGAEKPKTECLPVQASLSVSTSADAIPINAGDTSRNHHVQNPVTTQTYTPAIEPRTALKETSLSQDEFDINVEIAKLDEHLNPVEPFAASHENNVSQGESIALKVEANSTVESVIVKQEM